MDFCKIAEYFSANEKFTIKTVDHVHCLAHKHDFFELVYVLEGCAENRINDKKYIVHKGDYFIMDRHSVHAYDSLNGKPFVIINCLFLPELIDNSLHHCKGLNELINNYLIKFDYSKLSVKPDQYIFHDSDEEIYNLLHTLQTEANSLKIGYTEIIRAYLIQILILTMRKIATNCEHCTNISSRIIHYIEENYYSEISLYEISRKLCYSAPYISKKVKEETGCTFIEWVQKVRIRECCRQLTNTEEKIEIIARNCGFFDINYFRGIFKKFMGVSPRGYRSAQSGQAE